jgi:GR25 family glycosyltransferase involved in LPS biosynthesis
MENIFDKIPTENFYIQAIDGKENAYISNTFKDSTLSKYEIANTLSHLKAINFLNQKEGNYFLILEDNISIKNAKLLEEDIERIIKYSPEFDILVLNQTYTKKIQQPSNYIKWNDYYVDENDYIRSTLAYIITKSAIQKIVETNKYIDDTNFEIENIDVADRFLYKKLNTYVYYLNYFGANSEQSTIHSQHLQLFRQNNIFHYKKILKERFQVYC